MAPLLGIILVSLAVGLGVFMLIWLASGLFRLLGMLIARLWAFVSGEILDVFRFLGSVLLFPVLSLLTVASVIIGRWSAAAHYGRAVTSEIKTAALCVYRCAIGHPLRLLGLDVLTEGLEKRLPDLVAAAPTSDKPKKSRAGQFDGYKIIGSLPGGGSGAKLYIAEPDEFKRAGFDRAGADNVDQVVIKVFSLDEGSSLPQIIRESRSLEAARRLGLVLEHELNDQRFFYVMRFVPGDQLTLVTQRMHAEAGPEGLSEAQIRRLCGYAIDLLETLKVYHGGGLWHKDVKPDNIIVDPTGAHLVDLGLITPLRSAMTLTTHGTEYFRDPELVRMALKGVKVHEVNGAKFDVYATGAVLYAMLENSFPAHGGLSQLVKPCPESLRWIVRRAMTEYDKRYESSDEMLADLRAALASPSLASVKPAALPSVAGGKAPAVLEEDADRDPLEVARMAKAASPMPRPEPARAQASAHAEQPAGPAPKTNAPKIRNINWWTGRYEVAREEQQAPKPPVSAYAEASAANAVARAHRATERRPATEQLASARARIAARRDNARGRRGKSRHGARPGLNSGVVVAIAAVLGIVAVPVTLVALWDKPGNSPKAFASADASKSDRADFMAGVHDAAANAIDSARVATASAVVPFSSKGSKGRVLIVSDYPQPMSKQLVAEVRTAVAALNRGGFETIGDLNEREITNLADLAWEIELIARVKKLRASRPLDASDTMNDLRAWVEAHDDADALIWLAPDRDRRGRDLQGDAGTSLVAASSELAMSTTLGRLDTASLYDAAMRVSHDEGVPIWSDSNDARSLEMDQPDNHDHDHQHDHDHGQGQQGGQ